MLDNLACIREESRNLVGYKISKSIFEEFQNPNNRLIIGVACLREGYHEVACSLFASIAEEGSKQNADHHFAYVRSRVELAKLEAAKGRFAEAREHMQIALGVFPKNMGYMMSRIHLDVDQAYYCFRSDRKEDAYKQIAAVCKKEQARFSDIPIEDAYEIVGTGLCYAIHQWALFYAEERDWVPAIEKLKELFHYTSGSREELVAKAEELENEGSIEEAFYCYEEAINYT